MRSLAPLLLIAAPMVATAATFTSPLTTPYPAIQVAQIQPAQFVTGVLTRIDADTRTIMLGNETYYVRDNDAFRDFQTGQTVELTYLPGENGRREVVAMRRTDPPPRERALPFP